MFYLFVLGTFAVWRVTHLLNAEDGPWQLVVRLRRRAGSGLWGELLDCFLCLSLWVSVPFALWIGRQWKERFLLWPALSAGAILLERITARPAPPAYIFEDQETSDVLRQEQTAVPEPFEPAQSRGSNGSHHV